MDAGHHDIAQHLSVFLCKGEGEAAERCDLFPHLLGVHVSVVADFIKVRRCQPVDHLFPVVIRSVYVNYRLGYHRSEEERHR